jgi:antitoxin ParD1/3/4
MSKNTSVTLGNYFEQFVQNQVSAGRYKNVSEVIRAGLRLLENEESKSLALKNAIQEGIDSGIAHVFDPQKNLEELKAKKNIMAEYRFTNKALKDLNEIWDYTLFFIVKQIPVLLKL